MKILIATGIYPPDIGGPATYSALLKEEFPKRGHIVKILTYGPAGISRIIPGGLRHLIYFIACLYGALSCDVIFAQNQLSAGLPAMLAAKIFRRKFVMRVPGDSVWEWAVQKYGIKDSIDSFQNKKYARKIELRRKIQKFVTNNADAIIVPSFYFKNVVSGWTKNSQRIHVIYNGIKLNNLGKLDITENKDKIIFSVGRMVPWKGFDVLIEIMTELSDWRLILVGDGPTREQLIKMIDRLNLKERVTLKTSMPREELLVFLSKARIFILNTSFESFSFQVVEAMHVGVPVITTNIGNLSEIIDNNKEGILVEPNSKQQIIKAIKKIEQDDNFRRNIVINAYQKSQRFSLKNTLDNLEKLLESLL